MLFFSEFIHELRNVLGGLWSPLLLAFEFWWVWMPIALVPYTWHVYQKYARLWYYWMRGPWIIQEIKIPIEILKTPKAMEQILTGFWSTFTGGNQWERLYLGREIEYFSLELVGMRGQTHFYMCYPEGYRPFFESLIYAEYPDAEIAVVEDYFNGLPEELPAPGWRIQGTELAFTCREPEPYKSAYPIRTYLQFEDSIEERRIDPMSHFTELFNQLRDGEYVIYQILMRPINYTGPLRNATALVNRLIGKKVKPEERGWASIAEAKLFGGTLWAAVKQLVVGGELQAPTGAEEAKNEFGQSLMLHLSPGDRAAVEAIEMKASKAPCEVNFRMVYVGREELFRAKAMVSGLFGNTGLFGTGDLNGFMPHNPTKTWVDYFTRYREPRRQARLWKEMRKRLLVDHLFETFFRPAALLIMNVEELATIWHFPIKGVVTPLIPRIEAKKAEPPAGLPVG